MPNTEYIKELTSPSIRLTEKEQTIPPERLASYFGHLEELRVSFEEYLSDLDETVVRAYLQEVVDAKSTIERRGYALIPEANIAALLLGGEETVAHLMKNCKVVDGALLKSADKTIAFINTVLGVGPVPVASPQPQRVEVVEEEEPKTDPVKVISGIKGLAKFLGCGLTKANEIVQGGVLKDAGIQYMVGNCWKFNAEKLSKYLTEHPEVLGPKRVR